MGKVYIGMGGWELHSFDVWFYPKNAGRGFRKLEFYSRFFDTMEVNSTFYNTDLTPRNSRRWILDVEANEEFLFTVKLYRGFTHTLDAGRKEVAAVRALLEPMAEAGKLGGLLMQFPGSFGNSAERRQYLSRLAAAFRGAGPLFLEVRHDSWNTPGMFDFIRGEGMHLVNVDLPAIGRHMPFTGLAWEGLGYFRMMGRNADAWNAGLRLEDDGRHAVSDRYHYHYSESELEALLSAVERVRALTERTFVVFHNDPEANSLVNGFQLRHRLKSGAHLPLEREHLRRYDTFQPKEPAPRASRPRLPGI